ncbi:DNA repair protein RadA [Candidatus Peregrinibacteria bacterium]|nr:MAG: DNA repair protein RadA [Candidatus Peregrinibacteria bacterium]
MTKEKGMYECGACGNIFPKWSGKCPSCHSWNTIAEKTPEIARNGGGKQRGVLLSAEKSHSPGEERKRMGVGIQETDRVLGGGLFPDSLTLLVGNPGIGKSTLALQMARNIALQNPQKPIFIISGEESGFQVLERAKRLGTVPENLKVSTGFRIEDVLETAEQEKPAFLVVDSVQTFSSGEIPSASGSLPQIRAVTESLMYVAKAKHIPVLLIGQVTKGGEMAGPQLLAHLVDAVLQFEGDDRHELRMLRALKNRFGSTSEVGIFEMTEVGLREVMNPSEVFLSGRLPGAIGSVIFPAVEGQRPFLLEMQALTATTPFGLPKRSASGFSLARLSLLLAVLEKHAGIRLSSLDVFANVVGGLKTEEPGADLAMCLAIASSKTKKAVPETFLALGEIGLSGEVRAISQLEKRLREGEKLGFTDAILPSSHKIPKTSLQLHTVRTVAEAVGIF